MVQRRTSPPLCFVDLPVQFALLACACLAERSEATCTRQAHARISNHVFDQYFCPGILPANCSRQAHVRIPNGAKKAAHNCKLPWIFRCRLIKARIPYRDQCTCSISAEFCVCGAIRWRLEHLTCPQSSAFRYRPCNNAGFLLPRDSVSCGLHSQS